MYTNEETDNSDLNRDNNQLPLHKAAAELYSHSHRWLKQLCELFTLEVRYSGVMLGVIVVLSVVTAFGVLSVWCLAQAAIIAWLLESGWQWVEVLSFFAFFNGLLVMVSLWLILRAIRRIGINNTRQVLGLGTSSDSN